MPDRELILKYALQNAVFYGGKASHGAVMGKVMAERPGLRENAAGLGKEIAGVIAEVNRMKPAEQKRRLSEMGSGLLEKKEKVQELLPPLPGAVEGGVVTRFAPAPSGPLHILHLLRALGLSYEYARKYRGRFILRLEDTDPKKADRKAYEWIKQDMKSLGFEWDSLVLESSLMADYYRFAEKLISEGKFYVCSCDAARFKELKLEKKDCPCRKLAPGESMKRWKEMLSGKSGLVARMKTSMSDPNPALRDPPMLRVSNERHALVGTKYHAWPLYNFANVVGDHMSGVTHAFRGKEHEHNTAVQERLYEALGWEPPITVNFGMMRLEGGRMHKRDIRQMLASGKLSGWDDPSLPTIRALLRRGYQPEALRQSVFACGLSKNDITVNMDSLNAANRKLIDPKANRYMAVFSPVKISIAGLSLTEARMPLHPDFHGRGKRTIPVDSRNVYVGGNDFREFGGKLVRLKGICNIRLGVKAAFMGNEPKQELQKLQWVSEPNVKVILIGPGGKDEGIGEPGMQKLKPGSIIQMERVGFARVDSVENGLVTLLFAHK